MQPPLETEAKLVNTNSQFKVESASLIGSRETYVKGYNKAAGVTLLGILLRRKGHVLAGFLFFFGLVAAITSVQRTFLPRYESSFQLLVSDPTDDGSGRGSTGSNFGSQFLGIANTVDVPTLTAVLQSRSLLLPVIKRFSNSLPPNSKAKRDFDRQWEDFIEGKADRLPIEIIQESGAQFQNLNVLKITYQERDAQVAKSFLDFLGKAYINYSLEQKNVKIEKGVSFLNREYPLLQRKVNRLETQIEDFRRQHRLVEPLEQARYLLSHINSNQANLEKIISEKALKRRVLETISSNNNLNLNLTTSALDGQLSSSERYQSILNDLLALNKKLAEAKVKFTAEDPVVISLVSRQKALQDLLAAEAKGIIGRKLSPEQLQNLGNQSSLSQELYKKYYDTYLEYSALDASERATRTVLNDLKAQFSEFPTLSRQYAALLREYEVSSRNYQNFIEAREKLRLDLAQRITTWEIISAPVLDIEPVSPNLILNLIAGVLGGSLFGAALAILFDRQDNVFHSSQEIKDLIDIPVLAEIPYIKSLCGIRSSEFPINVLNFLESEGNFTASELREHRWMKESFTNLYSNLEFLNADTRIKSICLTSSVPAEGKSLANIFLAKTLSDFGKRVLLVDADMRKPQVHQRLQLFNRVGLSNILTSEIEPAKVIQLINENFAVITSGQTPPDPAKLLSSAKMKALMAELREEFDYVIYDMPPLLGIPDAFFLAQNMDAMLLLISLGKVTRPELIQVLRDIQFRQLPLSGCVLNSHNSSYIFAGANTYYSYYYSLPEQDAKSRKKLAPTAKRNN